MNKKIFTTKEIESIDIFDKRGRQEYQLATWKRSDIPVEVVTQNASTKIFERHEYNNLAEAQKDYPQLTLNQGMRGRWFGRCEYVLRFEEYIL